jgi:hypothetical protein
MEALEIWPRELADRAARLEEREEDGETLSRRDDVFRRK